MRTLGHAPPARAQAKQRLAKVDANPPKPGADDKDFLDEKRPMWVANGRPAPFGSWQLPRAPECHRALLPAARATRAVVPLCSEGRLAPFPSPPN